MLIAQNIKKSYGSLQVLRGVDLQINSGEVVSIVGSSGAGKSTLLHILGTLDQPDSGTMVFDQVHLSKLRKNDLATIRNQKMGFIFQFHNLLPEFSALENVCIPGFIAKQDHKTLEKKGMELLEILGISGRADHKPSELSGGEQQRVAVARSLINNPKLVFADEPSGNLDSKNAKELHKLFFDLKDQYNQTFVIVTHNEDLAEMADRKLIMADGIITHDQ
ncbi:MAG: ABC transporter ATP-binding protein [Bacteroidota bacterium]